MGTDSKIAWTDHTFNPWWGCEKISPGCTHCYAESLAKRTGNHVWGGNAQRRFFGESHWAEPLKWARRAEKSQLPHKPRVFCASMADVCEDRRDLDDSRCRLWMLIRETSRQLTWLLLTKRPENLLRLVPEDILLQSWIGTTVEDQRRAEERIPRLLATPASVRFVSCEPLLEAVSLASWLGSEQISWVIVGGESGGHARPFEVRWARILLQQCRDAGVPFFMKQLGSNVQHPNSDAWTRDPVRIEHQGTAPYHRVLLCARAGENPHEWPEDLRVREWPQ